MGCMNKCGRQILHRKLCFFLWPANTSVVQQRLCDDYLYNMFFPSNAQLCTVQGHNKTTKPALTATSTIEHDWANHYAAFLQKNLHGGVLSGIINSPCVVTALLRKKVTLRAVCKAVPLQLQCSDWESASRGFYWASGPHSNEREGGGGSGAQPGAKDFDTNIITDNWFCWWGRCNIKG